MIFIEVLIVAVTAFLSGYFAGKTNGYTMAIEDIEGFYMEEKK